MLHVFFTAILLYLAAAATQAVHLRSARPMSNVPSNTMMLGTGDNINAAGFVRDEQKKSTRLPLAILGTGDDANAGLPAEDARIHHSVRLPLAIVGTEDNANAVPASDVPMMKEHDKHVVVLITGQKSRLELESKVNHVILPLSEKYDVTVVFSLSNTNHFTNEYKYKSGEIKTLGISQGNVSTEIKMLLNSIPYYMNDIEYPTLKINNDIVSMYDKQNMGFKFEQKRAKNHVRQYYTLSQSMSTVNKLEPDILIRIRDDAMIKQTLDWMSLLKFIEMSDKNIITHACNSWRGINDKFAIVSKNAISTYLRTPLEVYNTYKKGDLGPGRFTNPEQFLSKVYVKEGLSLLVYNFQLKIKNQPDAGFYKHNGVLHRHLGSECKLTSDDLLQKDS